MYLKQEEYQVFFTRPRREISTKTHLLELSTMINVVRNPIKCILVNERPRDISLARLRDLICRVSQSVKDVSVCHYIFQRRKSPLGFSNNIWLEDKSLEFSVSHPSLVSRTWLATHFITDIKWIRNSIWKIRNMRRTRNTIFAATREAKVRNNFAQQVITSTYCSKQLAFIGTIRYNSYFCSAFWRLLPDIMLYGRQHLVHIENF